MKEDHTFNISIESVNLFHLPKQKQSKDLNIATKKIILIGSSTGGTEVVKDLLHKLPLDFPPVIIVQHMPADFTTQFAQRLTHQCGRKTIEVTRETEVKNGEAYLAPGGSHLKIKSYRGKVFVYPDSAPPVNRFRPSVSVLFQSAVDQKIAGETVALMLTGMGKDGVEEMKKLKDAGAVCFAQDEESSVVFGMPKAAIEIGAIDLVLNPQMMVSKLSEIKCS